MSKGHLYSLLLCSAAIGAVLASGQAHAQAPAPASAPQGAALEEVVVTATRQADTVNRVSLSVAAVTQKSLDAQGVKQAVDLVRLVPGLSIAGGNIRNIALNAAFLAADSGQPVRMAHILRSARSEYAKLEKPLTEIGIGGI